MADKYVVVQAGATVGPVGLRRGEVFTPGKGVNELELTDAQMDRLVALGAIKDVSKLTDEEKADLNSPFVRNVETIDVAGQPVAVENVSDQAGGVGAVTEPGNPNSPQALPKSMTEGDGASATGDTKSKAEAVKVSAK